MPTLTKLYSMEEVSQHNTNEDCWVVIDGKVYDVSEYLDEHPGGDDVLLGATGKDATDEFEDAGHGRTARELMDQFFIGELDLPTPAIPELEKDEEADDLQHKVLNFSKQYWFLPLALVGLSIAVRLLFQKKK